MELKDVILSTLAEMEEEIPVQALKKIIEDKKSVQVREVVIEKQSRDLETKVTTDSNELAYLSSIRERLLVLFEGFQAPNNTDIEAKVDMTLNFLEYILATIDTRVQILEKGSER